MRREKEREIGRKRERDRKQETDKVSQREGERE